MQRDLERQRQEVYERNKLIWQRQREQQRKTREQMPEVRRKAIEDLTELFEGAKGKREEMNSAQRFNDLA